MEAFNALQTALGIGVETRDLSTAQVCARAFVIFFAALLMMRMADKRFFAKKTAFDVILALILASTMGRAINGAEPIGATIVAGFLLVGLHRLLAMAARRHHGFGCLIKGNSETLIEDGVVNQENLRRNDFSMNDLLEELRLNGQLQDPSGVKIARLERNGDLSVIPVRK